MLEKRWSYALVDPRVCRYVFDVEGFVRDNRFVCPEVRQTLFITSDVPWIAQLACSPAMEVRPMSTHEGVLGPSMIVKAPEIQNFKFCPKDHWTLVGNHPTLGVPTGRSVFLTVSKMQMGPNWKFDWLHPFMVVKIDQKGLLETEELHAPKPNVISKKNKSRKDYGHFSFSGPKRGQLRTWQIGVLFVEEIPRSDHFVCLCSNGL